MEHCHHMATKEPVNSQDKGFTKILLSDASTKSQITTDVDSGNEWSVEKVSAADFRVDNGSYPQLPRKTS